MPKAAKPVATPESSQLLSEKVRVERLRPEQLRAPVPARSGWWLDVLVVMLAGLAITIPLAKGAGAFHHSPEIETKRGVLIMPAQGPTRWPGLAEMQSTRNIAPDWVNRAIAAADKPRKPREALAEPLLAVHVPVQPALSPHVLATGIDTQESPVTEVGDIPKPVSPRQASPLAPLRMTAPQPRPSGLLERSLAGLGVNLGGNETPVVIAGVGSRPRIAIVLTAAGLKPDATLAALSLPAPGATLAIAPIAAEAGRWAADARAMGRGALVEMPMEPGNYPLMNPGELTLLTTSSPQENLDRSAAALAMVPKAQGISVYLGARFVTDAEALAPLVAQWTARGMILFEPQPVPNSRLGAVAATAGAVHLVADVQIDRVSSPEAMKAALERLEQLARTRGRAIGVGVTQATTVGALHEWMQGLADRGIQLVPLEQMAMAPGVVNR